ncbi:MAG: phosphoribosyl-ATP diphosphatase [Pseudomonadota bacterium]|nr:phosphoribosyl-ATP diphosphatase [Pseudomonadota bacterium]
MTVIEFLEDMLAERRFGDPEKSYVSKLHHKGLDHILRKVGEEAIEVVMAAKDAARSKNNEDVIHEVADLWFHTLVLLSHLEEPPSAVLAELERRLGVSGLVEKANREN